ncbi:MAG: nuclear transport factor 2 family protein [Chitinophagaceae bacterium]|nr:nuclear transport factor 2 family protein [Chitinophagaceae bacterium]
MQKVKFLLIVSLFSINTHAQTANKEQSAIHETIENTFAALSVFDTVSLKTFVTADVRFYEYGQVWTIDTLIQKMIASKTIKDFKRSNSFQYVNTTIKGNTAWVTYYLQSVIIRNGKEDILNWMETVVLLKVKKSWKIDVLHSTRLMKN